MIEEIPNNNGKKQYKKNKGLKYLKKEETEKLIEESQIDNKLK